MTFYEGTASEWMEPRFAESRERFNREGGGGECG
jgi:hypothetical protein